MTDDRPPSEQLLARVLDLTVYAPVGIALAVKEQLPKRAQQGRQAMENRIQLARFIGQLAVQTGQREVARRIEEQRAAREAPAGRPVAAADETADEAAEVEVQEVEVQEVEVPAADLPDSVEQLDGAGIPSADELPISDYESLAAIHVVERLRSMRPDEIELIRRFELAHRARRTVLAKIQQLQDR